MAEGMQEAGQQRVGDQAYAAAHSFDAYREPVRASAHPAGVAAPQDADVLPAAMKAELRKHSHDPGGEPDALLVLLDGAGKVGDESHDSQSLCL